MSELINARITNDEIENYKKLKKAMKGLYLITEKDIADDINDTITNVMKDYKSQTIILNNKLEQQTLRRKEAESISDELAELMTAIREGEYKPDSFTNQPYRTYKAKYKDEK